MFTFTLVISIASVLLSAVGGLWSYLAFKSDDGGATGVIGTVAGVVIGLVSLVFASVGIVGLAIVANRMWG